MGSEAGVSLTPSQVEKVRKNIVWIASSWLRITSCSDAQHIPQWPYWAIQSGHHCCTPCKRAYEKSS
jgi:hypothetical protein